MSASCCKVGGVEFGVQSLGFRTFRSGLRGLQGLAIEVRGFKLGLPRGLTVQGLGLGIFNAQGLELAALRFIGF